MAIPITEVIDIETQSTVALASTPAKAAAMITALEGRAKVLGDDYKYYAEEALPIDLIEF
jgi:hypothetical protein